MRSLKFLPFWIATFYSLIFMACRSEQPAAEASLYTQPTPPPEWARLLDSTPAPSTEWNEAEIALLRSLWLGSLPPVPHAPTNAVADNPQAAALGHRLFFDTRLSANNQVSCATCHIPKLAFTDGLATAHGTHPNRRNTMSIIGSAYAPWLLWDGHKDTLWAQAVEPIEAVDEQGATRLHAVHLMANDDQYRTAYEAIFGTLPDLNDYNRFPHSGGPVDFLDYRTSWEQMTAEDQESATHVFANMGKAIAAYERLINPGISRFDRYVEALLMGDSKTVESALTTDEVAGLRLFIGPANCTQCHNGPLFSDFGFHNTGTPAEEGQLRDEGRIVGIQSVLSDEFNCRSANSDCPHLDSAQKTLTSAEESQLRHLFRTPILRNVAETGPYMHAGQFATLADVLVHYNQAPDIDGGRSEIRSLGLATEQLAQLEAFLRTLSAPPSVAPALLIAPKSGQ